MTSARDTNVEAAPVDLGSSPGAESGAAPSHCDALFAAGLTAAFLAVCGFTTWRHQMWRDELQAWMLARYSPTLTVLFHELKYEGHPGLWYVILFSVTRLTHALAAMQAVHVLIATAVAFTVARYSPFTRLQRILLVFGYFPLFEYGVISRNYGLGMLLLFMLCASWRRQWRRPLVPALLLVAMAHTNIYSFILAVAFSVSAAARFVRDAEFRKGLLAQPIYSVAAVGIVLVGMASSALQLRPPPDSSFVVGWHFWPGPAMLPAGASHLTSVKVAVTNLAAAMGTVWKAYVPFPKLQVEFWNTNVLQGNLAGLQPLLAIALIAWGLWMLRRRHWALVFYLVGVVALVTFTYAKYFGYVRHQGAQYLLLIAALWIAGDAARDDAAKQSTPAAPDSPTGSRFFTALLGMQMLVGLIACAINWVVPFSSSHEAATYLQTHGLADRPIVGHWDYTASPFAALLDRPVYLADSQFRLGSYIRWTVSRQSVSDDRTIDFAQELARERHEPIMVILTPDPTHDDLSTPVHRPGMREIAHFTRSIEPDERFWIYEVEP